MINTVMMIYNDDKYGYDDKYIKTEIKKYADNIITNFHNKKNAKRKSAS